MNDKLNLFATCVEACHTFEPCLEHPTYCYVTGPYGPFRVHIMPDYADNESIARAAVKGYAILEVERERAA